MKKSITLILIGVFIFLGIGLSFSNGKYETKENVNLIFANVTTTAAKDAAIKFKELAYEYSDGSITVDVFQDNQLGDDKSVFESAQIGDIDIVAASTSSLSSMYKDYYLFDTPYLFLNAQEVYDVGFAGKAGNKIADGVESMNLKALSMWENGFRNYTNNDKEIKLPKDVKGMKIRTMENEVHLKAWSELGANPTPMAFSELFTALQQGTVDGQENPIGIIKSNRFYEVQKYITLTEHVYTPYCIVMNEKKYDSLTDKQKEALERAMKEATEYQIAESNKADKQAIDEMKEYGCEITILTDEEKEEFQKIIKEEKIFDLVKKNMDNPKYFDELQKELEEYRGDK